MGNYIGRDVPYGQFDTQVLTPNSVLTTFNLTYKVSTAASILVVLAGAIQQPNIQYSLSNGGTQIVFTSAPTTGSSLFILYLGREMSSASIGNSILAFSGSGTNSAGNDMTIGGGQSTGNANGGSVILKTTPAGPSGSSLNSFIERAIVKPTGQVRFVPLSADPSGEEAGDVYYNSTTNKLRVYNGTAWVDLH
jgi:hypothetical protein